MSSDSSSNPAAATIAKLTYDQRFYAVLGVSVTLIVLCALWIVSILVSIEANKAAFFSITDNSNSLEMTVDEDDGLEHETKKQPNSPKSPTSSSSTALSTKGRRVRMSFKMMQVSSVSVLLLLTYLLLVVSDAPLWTSALGSLCVFAMFLRYQIGDELRRQRVDRILLMLSLFLTIASLMSLCTYAYKSLGNGEIYEGPARIVGYDMESYNNTDHDPSTRMDLEVQWGHAWGCPLSGGKVCTADVQGAMCTVNMKPDTDAATSENDTDDADNNNNNNHPTRQRQRQRRTRQQRRKFPQQQQQQRSLEEPPMGVEATSAPTMATTTKVTTAEDLQAENEELEQENEQLQKEVEELELAKEETEQVADEEVEEYEEEEAENAALNEEEIETVEEEELEVEEEFTDAYIDVEEEKEKVEEEYVDDPEVVEEDEETITELEDEKVEIDEMYGEYEEEYAEDAEEEEEEADEAGEVASEILAEEGETEGQYNGAIEDVAEGDTTEAQDEALQEAAQETVDNAIAVAQGEDDTGDESEWYWDEITYEYDDDAYSTEYWDYDWESVWGEYACEDLFDEDTAGLTYDPTMEAGKDDYPYVTIYGSCKTCEAYVLDYFAEQAFESVEEHKKMAVAYMTGAMVGFFVSFLSYITFKVRPQAENEIELLDTNSGVMA